MLEYLRKANEKPLAKFFMFILMFSFVGWGVANWIFGQTATDDTIVSVGAEPIGLSQFEREKSRQLTRLDRAQQKQIYAEPAVARGFYQQILQTMISRALLDNRAADLGFHVSSSMVASVIRNMPEFQDKGKFSPEKFDSVLYANGLDEQTYADVVRAEILRNMVMQNLGAPVSDFAVRAAFDARYGLRKIEFARVAFDGFKVAAKPSDADLQLIYSQNPKTIPEVREVSYAVIAAKMDQPDSFDKGYAAAQRLEDLIISGEPLKAAASKLGAKFSTANVDAGTSDKLLARAFSLEQGIESEIIETPAGFAILRVEKIVPAHAAPLPTVRDEIKKKWRTEQQRKLAYSRANEILIKLNQKNIFEGKKSADITRTSGAPLDLLTAAFNAPIGTKTIVPAKDAFYVLQIVSESAPKADAAKMSALKKEMQTMMARAVSDDYVSFLQRQYPAKINKRMFKRVFGE